MKKIVSLALAAAMTACMMPAVSAASSTADYNGHRYERIEESMSWTDAKKYCEDRGGYLAVITSQAEQEAVQQLVAGGSRNNYWIGAYRSGSSFAWVTGESFSYTNWDSGEPNNDPNQSSESGENYVMMYRVKDPSKSKGQAYAWNDCPNAGEVNFYKLSNYGFVCEYDRVGSTWAQPELQKADEYKLIPDILENADYTKSITRLEFAAVAVKTYENMAGTSALPAVTNPFTDCSDTEMLKAYNLGITTGTSATTFSPNALLDRQQAATMLTRVFKRATMPGWTVDTDSQFTLTYTQGGKFADDANIASWAKDSVYFMAANSIISGVGNNKFAPTNTTSAEQAKGYANATREQALAIAVRMVENLK